MSYRIVSNDRLTMTNLALSTAMAQIASARSTLAEAVIGSAGTADAARVMLASADGSLLAVRDELKAMQAGPQPMCADCGETIDDTLAEKVTRHDSRTMGDVVTLVCFGCETAAKREAASVRADDHRDAREAGH